MADKSRMNEKEERELLLDQLAIEIMDRVLLLDFWDETLPWVVKMFVLLTVQEFSYPTCSSSGTNLLGTSYEWGGEEKDEAKYPVD